MKDASGILALFVLASSSSLLLAQGATTAAQAKAAASTWIESWGASQQIPEPNNALPVDDLRDATVRQIFHLSVGGPRIRVHLSNAFGTSPLHFTSVHVARPRSRDSATINPLSDHALTFAGKPDVIVPPGAEMLSDPLDYPVALLSDLAVTFHIDEPPARQTGHPGSRATSYYIHGDFVSSPHLVHAIGEGAGESAPGQDCVDDAVKSIGTTMERCSPPPKHVDHWYNVSGIDVLAPAPGGTIIALGDSITDGHGATTNGNDRWTDVLAARLQAWPSPRNIGVSNRGIGGNHVLTDGLGPNVLARFDRDVLAPAGSRWLIVFGGVNDLGGLAREHEVPAADHALLVARVIAAYQQVIERAHAHGLRVYGATITPYADSGYYHPGPLSEADRVAVNQWIRTPGHFDDVIDFDAVVRDPQRPDHLLPEYDCGDHLHPSPAGYKAMGEAVPLSLFAQ